MKPLGIRKIRTSVAGHQHCGICHPRQRFGRARARRLALRLERAEATEELAEDDQDLCGLCGEPGELKYHHPCHWPGEQVPQGQFVHAACEQEECERAFQAFRSRVGEHGVREFLRGTR